MTHLEHKNIVQLLGVCSKEMGEMGDTLMIVMELLERGNLKELLVSSRDFYGSGLMVTRILF